MRAHPLGLWSARHDIPGDVLHGRLSVSSEAHVGTVPTVVPPRSPREEVTTVERCGWSLVWFASLIAGIGFWGSWTSWPAASVISPLLSLIGIAGIAAVWLVRDPVSRTM